MNILVKNGFSKSTATSCYSFLNCCQYLISLNYVTAPAAGSGADYAMDDCTVGRNLYY